VSKKCSIFHLLWHSSQQCLTPVRHSYDTCRTSVLNFFIFSMLKLNLSLEHISNISTRVKDMSKQQHWSIRNWRYFIMILIYFFNFFDSRWIMINKGKILSYLVFKLFLRNNWLNLDLHVCIFIINLYFDKYVAVSNKCSSNGSYQEYY
jgi:hypothetical protein